MPKKLSAPVFVEKLCDHEVVCGKTAVMDCVVTGEPLPDIEWFYEGQLVKDKGRFRYLYEKDDVIGLEIIKCGLDDEGMYECVAKNKSGKATSKCELLVNEPAGIVVLPKGSCCDIGKSVSFEFEETGNPRPDIEWTFNGKKLKNEEKYIMTSKNSKCTLVINDVSQEDGGIYTVMVSNEYGKESKNVELKVEDRNTKTKSSANDTKSPKTGSINPTSAKRRESKKKKLPIERDGLIDDNPAKYYKFGEEIGRGKFSVVQRCTKLDTGEVFAAKSIKFDAETLKFAIREYDLMVSGHMDNKGLIKLKEAYLVRKYLVIIMELAAGLHVLDQTAKRHSLTEDDVADIIRQICETLADLHSKNIVHLDIRPTNLRYDAVGSKDLKLLDYNSARHIANKKAGEVVDVIGDTEFCAPEMLQFDPVTPASDMWSVGVLTYILLSGISPFYYEDEDEVLLNVQAVNYAFDEDLFDSITSEAKAFIKKCFVRIPEMRMSAEAALQHTWLSSQFQRARKNSTLDVAGRLKTTVERLLEEEEEEYIEASLVFRTFEEEEYESPEEEYEEE